MAVTHSTTPTHPQNSDYDVSFDAWTDDHAIDSDGITIGVGGPSISAGSGSPEGSVTAEPGSLYLRSTGVPYIKRTGSGDTGWEEFVWND